MAKGSRLFVFILLSLLRVAQAATATTSAQPSKTYCPQFYSTPTSPRPTSAICATQGELSTPNTLATYCLRDLDNLGLGTEYEDTDTYCYRACVQDLRCVSFSLDDYNSVCYVYGKSLSQMGFKRSSRLLQRFWNLRECYVCKAPAPLASSCPIKPDPKPLPQPGYTCGKEGTIPDNVPYIYSQFGPPPADSKAYNTCYSDSVKYYDLTGQLATFTYSVDSRGYSTCRAYNRSLLEAGFTYKTGTNLRGWNVRGCFKCNKPRRRVPTCVPPSGPRPAGLLNGKFNDTFTDSTSGLKEPSEWDYSGAVSVKTLQNRNNVAVLRVVPISEAGSEPRLVQTVFGTQDPNQVTYIITWDLAIPQADGLGQTPPNRCLIAAAVSGSGPTYVDASNKTYQGNTLRPGPPFRLATNEVAQPIAGFEVSCPSNGTFSPNVTFYVDNVRLTLNGRDFP